MKLKIIKDPSNKIFHKKKNLILKANLETKEI